MRIAITGSSGLIGKALAAKMDADGHSVLRIVRGAPTDPAAVWDPPSGWVRPGTFDGVDAVVHLAGESIGEGRWTPARKAALRSSRVDTTAVLVSEFEKLAKPPALVSASAIGYYGDRSDEILDEASGRGTGFLADLTADWEAAAHRAEDAGSRVAVLRFGVVLDRKGGALPRMLRPFKLGAGGRLGNGRQWFSWVTLDDAVSAVRHVLQLRLDGVYNVAAPSPVTNRELTAALAKSLRRPAIFPVPPVALRLLLGESANELLLASQRVLPRALEGAGFHFRHTDISLALAEILRPDSAPMESMSQLPVRR